jgi:2,3-diketo-5-methylthio-1-phosphopentane phosphatase
MEVFKMNLAVFCDFDGTISLRDVGYSVFHHFSNGKNEELLPDWFSGKMTTRDCLIAEAEMVNASSEELYDFVDKIDIDPTFPGFVDLCDSNQVPLSILSDGLDFYIKHLLGKNKLSHLKFVTNKAILEDNKIRIEFPHDNVECKSCGICKGEVIQNFRKNQNGEYKIIFIGDGYSDACAAKEADILFAKKDLVDYCNKNNIDYLSYDNFCDVQSHLIEQGYLKD